MTQNGTHAAAINRGSVRNLERIRTGLVAERERTYRTLGVCSVWTAIDAAIARVDAELVVARRRLEDT